MREGGREGGMLFDLMEQADRNEEAGIAKSVGRIKKKKKQRNAEYKRRQLTRIHK